jgi:hypothetical protein
MTVPATPAIDPAATGARVVVADAAATLADVTVPSGGGWRVNAAGTAWKYADPAGPSGIVKVIVKTVPRTPGLVKFTVLGKRGAFATSAAALPLHATFTLAADGQCGEARFAAPSACGFNRRGTVVTCR